MSKKSDNRFKSDEQKFAGILGSVKYRKVCSIPEMARALLLRYGIEDLKEWVQDSHMLDTLAACDPDVELLVKYMYKNARLSNEYLNLFKGMDLKKPDTRKYCFNLAVRDLVLSALEYGADLDSLEECGDESEVA